MSSGARLPALTPHAPDDVPAELTGGVVAVGNFDGVHRGHAALLGHAREEADRLGIPAVALTFEPHPRTYFRPDAPVFRLTPLPAKARIMKALGIDGLVVAPFDRRMAEMPAGDFIERILRQQLKLRSAVVGFDFHFGKGREGSPSVLAKAGDAAGFEVKVFEAVTENGDPVASTDVRQALRGGDVAAATRLLGYRWFVTGEVVPGDKRGRTLGYPTANMSLGVDCQLRHGIYAAWLRRADGALYEGVASYGRRPTFGGGEPVLEVHVFDFSGDLYGEEVAVTLVGWIRPEQSFPSAEALVAAMNEDARSARAMLRRAGPGSPVDQAIACL